MAEDASAEVLATRRRFLKWATAVSSLAAAALAGVPVVRAFVSPAFRKPVKMRWIKLGEADLFDLGTPTKVDFAETIEDAWVEEQALRSVWVYSDDGEAFTVYNGRCTHLGCAYRFDKAPDPQYHSQADVFHCPCHHGVFNIKTGAVLAGPPPRPLDTLDTKIEDGMLYAAYEDFRVGIPDKVAT